MNLLFNKKISSLLGIFGLGFLATTAFAAVAGLPQERVKAAKVAYLTRELGLSPQEAEKFWPVYNEFENRREDLRHRMRDLMDEKEAGGYSSDERANAALDEWLSLREQELQLEKNFRKSMAGILPSKRLVVLHQAEREFQRELLKRLQEKRENGGGARRPQPQRFR
jgi:hypothetical protein